MMGAPDGYLAQVFVPIGHQRYEALCGWAKTAERRWWKFGHSSDGRAGIWVAYSTWAKDPGFLASTKSVLGDVKPEAAE